LIEDEALRAIIGESSGELALEHFSDLLAFSGYVPSLGAEQIAGYTAERCREFGLSDVRIEKFPSDGETFFWAFRTDPWWEGKKGELWIVEPGLERIASFHIYRGHLGRYSRSAQVKAELIDVGEGTASSHYEGKPVQGKIVLASGSASLVQKQAVWQRGAAGIVI
jgi:hypothetical protein